MPSELNLPSSLKSADPLFISAVGMRRKNLYVVEVDVYNAGLYLSESALKAAKSLRLKDPEMNELPSVLATHIATTGQNGAKAQVATKLVFVRDVGQSSVVEAFNDAFKGCNPSDVDNFKKTFGEAVGATGMKKGDSCTFIWLNGNGGLVVEKNGVITPVAKSPEIEKKLLQVYLQPSIAVSPELVSCLREKLVLL
jgi:hypothetical protein